MSLFSIQFCKLGEKLELSVLGWGPAMSPPGPILGGPASLNVGAGSPHPLVWWKSISVATPAVG